MKFLAENKKFLCLLIGETFSKFGDSILFIGLTILIYSKTSSPMAMGIIVFLATIPNLIFIGLGGVIADRYNIKKIMLIGDLSRAAILIIVPVLDYFNLLLPIHLYVITFIMSVFESFYMPAQGSAVPQIVCKEDLIHANSIFYAVYQIVGILGFALGGLLISFIGYRGAYIMDSVSFGIAAGLIALIKFPQISTEAIESRKEKLITSFINGLKFIKNTPILIIALIIFFFLGIMVGPLEVIVPYFINSRYADINIQSSYIGFIFSGLSLGIIMGTFVVQKLSEKLSITKILILSIISISALNLVQSFVITFNFMLIILFIYGIFISILRTIMLTEAYKVVTPEFRGRFSSVLTFVTLSMNPIMALFAGIILQYLGFAAIQRILFAISVPIFILLLIAKNKTNISICSRSGVNQ